jgi:hypothetical protein
MIDPVSKLLENKQLAIDNCAEVTWNSDASVARESPGWTVMGTQPVGGGQVVGGGTVALGMNRVCVGRTIGWGVGELKTGTGADVSVGVGGISGT